MKFKKIFILPLFILIMVLTLSFNIKATNRTYHLPIDTDDNYLLFVYSDSHTNYNMPLIQTNTFTIINRENDYYYFYPYTNPELTDYQYSILNLYCFHIQYFNVGLDDFELHINIYSLIPENILNVSEFTLLKQLIIADSELIGYEIDLFIDFENVIDIQNYSGIQVPINSETIYSYLFGNSMNPTHSTLGRIIEAIKTNSWNEGQREGFLDGYNQGVQTFRDGGIIKAFVNPVLTFFDNFFGLEIGPGITIGSIILIPLLFGVLGIILYFWRKD